METEVSFLCKGVQSLTEEDWGKLMRLLNYLKATKDYKRIMGSSD